MRLNGSAGCCLPAAVGFVEKAADRIAAEKSAALEIRFMSIHPPCSAAQNRANLSYNALSLKRYGAACHAEPFDYAQDRLREESSPIQYAAGENYRER